MFIELETSPSGKKVLVNLDRVKWIESNDPSFSDLVFEVSENGPVSLPVKGSIDDLCKRIGRVQGTNPKPPTAPSMSLGTFDVG